jgi:hypothetical protein
LHSDTVAEDRPSSERTRRVYRKHADRLAVFPEFGYHPVHEGGLAHSRGPGETHDVGVARAAIQEGEIGKYLCVPIINATNEPSGGPHISTKDLFCYRRHDSLSIQRNVSGLSPGGMPRRFLLVEADDQIVNIKRDLCASFTDRLERRAEQRQ